MKWTNPFLPWMQIAFVWMFSSLHHPPHCFHLLKIAPFLFPPRCLHELLHHKNSPPRLLEFFQCPNMSVLFPQLKEKIIATTNQKTAVTSNWKTPLCLAHRKGNEVTLDVKWFVLKKKQLYLINWEFGLCTYLLSVFCFHLSQHHELDLDPLKILWHLWHLWHDWRVGNKHVKCKPLSLVLHVYNFTESVKKKLINCCANKWPQQVFFFLWVLIKMSSACATIPMFAFQLLWDETFFKQNLNQDNEGDPRDLWRTNPLASAELVVSLFFS